MFRTTSIFATAALMLTACATTPTAAPAQTTETAPVQTAQTAPAPAPETSTPAPAAETTPAEPAVVETKLDVTPQPHANGMGAVGCFDASGTMYEAAATGELDGAVRAWLCGDAGQQFDYVGPNEPLELNVNEITKYVAHAPEVSGEIYEPGTAYTVVLD